MPFNFITLMAVLSLILTALVVATACGVIVALLAIAKIAEKVGELEKELDDNYDYKDFVDNLWGEFDPE